MGEEEHEEGEASEQENHGDERLDDSDGGMEPTVTEFENLELGLGFLALPEIGVFWHFIHTQKASSHVGCSQSELVE